MELWLRVFWVFANHKCKQNASTIFTHSATFHVYLSSGSNQDWIQNLQKEGPSVKMGGGGGGGGNWLI